MPIRINAQPQHSILDRERKDKRTSEDYLQDHTVGDLSDIVASRRPEATTVATTVFIAARAGVNIVATGGLLSINREKLARAPVRFGALIERYLAQELPETNC